MKNFINIADIEKKDLRKIIDHAKSQKEKRSNLNKSAIDPEAYLTDKILIMIFEKSGITPDIVPIAKGIGGGFPLGACLVTKKVAVGMTPGTHGSTFGGNPLAMSVGNAVLDIIF